MTLFNTVYGIDPFTLIKYSINNNDSISCLNNWYQGTLFSLNLNTISSGLNNT